MENSFRNIRAHKKPDDCVLASDMTDDQFMRHVARAEILNGAYRRAMIHYCRQYFDKRGISDVEFRQTCCLALRHQLAQPLLFAINLESEEYAASYFRETGTPPPEITPPDQRYKSTKYAAYVRGLWTDTLKEETRGQAEAAHIQRVKKIARAAREVELIDYEFKATNNVLYRGRPELADFFKVRLPQELDRP